MPTRVCKPLASTRVQLEVAGMAHQTTHLDGRSAELSFLIADAFAGQGLGFSVEACEDEPDFREIAKLP